jgi:myo-inositol-1(or 4)-monophosphatase
VRPAGPTPARYVGAQSMNNPSSELATLVAAAHAAGAGLMRRFRRLHEVKVDLKGPADFVSDADLESESTLRRLLVGAYPDHGFVAEESAPEPGDPNGARFIVDPLDGTANFVHGIPHFAVSIALQRGTRLVAGVVLDVAKGELFMAEVGSGAWLGRERLSVSKDENLSRALVSTGIPHATADAERRHAAYLPMLAATMREAAGIRRFASAAIDLAYVAAGRCAAFFELGLSPWDVAAGVLLVEEAGGKVSRPDGGADVLGTGEVLATNGRLHETMVRLLRASAPPGG